MTKVILVDDHQVIVDGLAMLLGTFPQLEVAATTTKGSRANALVREHTPDVVVTDASMPDWDGLAVVRDLKTHYPDLPVLVLTTFDDAQWVHSLIQAGAAGYILKDVKPVQLAEAIESVAAGGVVLDPRVARFAYHQPPGKEESAELTILTRAEKTVAHCVAQGHNNATIAAELHLAEGTVKNHISALLRKLGAPDRTVLALRLAKAFGL